MNTFTNIQIPPPLKSQDIVDLTGLIATFDDCCDEFLYTFLYRKKYMQSCTTKYIFWLGKNKFDRGMHFLHIM